MISRLFLPILLIFSFNIFPLNSSAETCQEIGSECVEPAQTRIVGGKSFAKDCWKYRKTKRCYADDYTDNCAIIKTTAGCEEITSQCLETSQVDQKCNRYQHTYQCGNLLAVASQATYLGSNYSVTIDKLNHAQCDTLYPPSNCEKTSSNCVEGAETRNINGYDIYKDCWKYEENYSCKTGSYINNCANIPTHCSFSSTQCLIDVNGNCTHRQNTYICSKSATTSTANVTCGSNVYCTNGQCSKVEDDSNPQDFAKSLSYLQSLNQMGEDNDGSSDNLKIFTGTKNSCDKSFANYNNCCSDSGWGQDYLGASCKDSEIQLMKSQEKKLCHYVGSYCSKKIPLIGTCQTNTKSYCCFGSKISRVINEQGKAQLGIGWGSGESPDCRGLTPAEMEKLQFDKMDLGEISADIASQAIAPNQSYIQDKVKNVVEGYGQKASN